MRYYMELCINQNQNQSNTTDEMENGNETQQIYVDSEAFSNDTYHWLTVTTTTFTADKYSHLPIDLHLDKRRKKAIQLIIMMVSRPKKKTINRFWLNYVPIGTLLASSFFCFFFFIRFMEHA